VIAPCSSESPFDYSGDKCESFANRPTRREAGSLLSISLSAFTHISDTISGKLFPGLSSRCPTRAIGVGNAESACLALGFQGGSRVLLGAELHIHFTADHEHGEVSDNNLRPSGSAWPINYLAEPWTILWIRSPMTLSEWATLCATLRGLINPTIALLGVILLTPHIPNFGDGSCCEQVGSLSESTLQPGLNSSRYLEPMAMARNSRRS
jgi:hypothetical protein